MFTQNALGCLVIAIASPLFSAQAEDSFVTLLSQSRFTSVRLGDGPEQRKSSVYAGEAFLSSDITAGTIAPNGGYSDLVNGRSSLDSSLVATREGGIEIAMDSTASSYRFLRIATESRYEDPVCEGGLEAVFHVEGQASYMLYGTVYGKWAGVRLQGESEIVSEFSGESIVGSGTPDRFEVGEIESGDYLFAARFGHTESLTSGARIDFKVVITPISPNLPIQLGMQLTKKTYSVGDDIAAEAISLSNASKTERAVEWKISLQPMDESAMEVFDYGYDESLVVPSGGTVDLGTFSLFTVDTSHPKGLYQLNSRALDPVSGELIGEIIRYFEIR